MDSTDHQRLIEKLNRIEALFADQAATPGEKAAAEEARERIRQRLAALAQTDPPLDQTFALRDAWSYRLFIALLRRHDIRPYGYARQGRTTVMARVPACFVTEALRPEFVELDRTLRSWFTQETNRVIVECINQDASEAEVRQSQALSAAAATVEAAQGSE